MFVSTPCQMAADQGGGEALNSAHAHCTKGRMGKANGVNQVTPPLPRLSPVSPPPSSVYESPSSSKWGTIRLHSPTDSALRCKVAHHKEMHLLLLIQEWIKVCKNYCDFASIPSMSWATCPLFESKSRAHSLTCPKFHAREPSA